VTKSLTNENLKGICNSNFELAHYAIAMGRYFIESGREVSLSEVLKEVRRHPDPNYLEELKEIDKQIVKEEAQEERT